MALEECCICERKRTEGQHPIQRWDCSQVGNEKEEESWQESDQMAEQWEEEQHLEEIVERRRMVKLDVIQKALVLVVMNESHKVKG